MVTSDEMRSIDDLRKNSKPVHTDEEQTDNQSAERTCTVPVHGTSTAAVPVQYQYQYQVLVPYR